MLRSNNFLLVLTITQLMDWQSQSVLAGYGWGPGVGDLVCGTGYGRTAGRASAAECSKENGCPIPRGPENKSEGLAYILNKCLIINHVDYRLDSPDVVTEASW